MGWINDGKANEAGRRARKAIEDGDRILVYKFIEASSGSSTTAPMAGIAGQIEAVEAEGWQLSDMSAAESKAFTGERVALICLFRRA
ncbi:MAG TPA: hypothetical protein VFH77_03560 [Streptomyces sp.]|jgi:hypothetical protein|nr:hypothetical protein [Streptomyces sp.]